MSILSVNSISFKYSQSSKLVLDKISFGIEKGSYTAIVGSNGCGKSTLARIICGLENPTEGNVEIAQDAKIGIVFQSPKNQIVSGHVSRDVAFGPQNLGIKKGEVELRTIECLNIVDLLEKAENSSSALSLGQTQKLALASNLSMGPEILILDEAVSMLDPESRDEIYGFLRYWHKCGNTIIHITHDVEGVSEAEKVIYLDSGNVKFYGTSESFLENPELSSLLNGELLPVCQRNQKKEENTFSEAPDSITLKTENLSFSYDTKSGLHNIFLKFKKGSLVALTGRSGAGKSTFLELCAGLLEPQSGTIYSETRPLLCQQNCQAALFETFAADDVAFGPRNCGLSGKKLVETVKKSMNLAGIPYEQFGNRQTFFLSGGEQRRLAIAGIIAMDPQIILFDEPTAGLDCESKIHVMKMMRKLAESGKTVIFSTHKKDEADFSDREIVIENGRVISDSDFEENENKSFTEAEQNLPVQNPYSAVSMLNGLRSVSLVSTDIRNKKTTPVKKMPSWARIVLFLAIFTFSLIGSSFSFCGIIFAVSLIYCKLCGFDFKNLIKSMLKILPFLLIFTVLQLIFHPALEDEIHFTNWKFFTITPSKLIFCLCGLLRTFASIGCISGFFVSTPEYDLIDGLKILLTPLTLIKIPVRYFILIIEIIFRFIPLLVDEAASIIKTQIIRGGMGKVKGTMGKIKAMLPLIVPLIIQTIKRSELLADAITMRCFK